MKRFLGLAFACLLELVAGVAFGAPEPAAANFLNVRSAAYGATGDGVTDDAPAINRAASDCVARKQHIYFPNGVYLLRDSIRMQRLVTLLWGGQCAVEGESRSGVIIRLADNLPAFQNPASPNGVFVFASGLQGGVKPGGNEAFLNAIADVTIDCGLGNPGCQAIDYVVSNRGAIRNTRILCNGTPGTVGIDMRRIYPGPGLIEDVEIEGCDYGMRFAQLQFTMTVKNARVIGARTAAVDLGALGLTLVNLHTEGLAPAVRQTSAAGFLSVLGLRASGGDPTRSALELAGGTRWRVRDVVTSGYANALRRSASTGVPVLTMPSPIAQATSAAPLQLFAGVPAPLEWHEPPARYVDGAPCVVPTNTSDGLDDAPAIQATLNTPGCPRVLVPHSPASSQGSSAVLASPLVIPCAVRDLDFSDNFVVVGTGYPTGQPMLQVTQNCPAPLYVTRFWKAGSLQPGAHFLAHRSSRTLVVVDGQAGGAPTPGLETFPGAGELHMRDYAGTADINGSSAYAEQWNPEFPSGTPGNTLTDGTLVVRGLKTEQDQTVLTAVRSRAMLDGLWLMPFASTRTPFVAIDSALSFSGVTAWKQGSTNVPPLLVDMTCGSERQTIPAAAVEAELISNGVRQWVPLFGASCSF